MIYIGVIFAALLLTGFITTIELMRIELMRRVNEKEEQKNERNRTSDY